MERKGADREAAYHKAYRSNSSIGYVCIGWWDRRIESYDDRGRMNVCFLDGVGFGVFI